MPIMRTSEVEVLKTGDVLGLKVLEATALLLRNVHVPMKRILRIDEYLVNLKKTPAEDYDQDYPFYR